MGRRVHMRYLDTFIYETMRFTSFVTVTVPHSKTSDVTWSVNHDPLRKWIADQFEIFFFETCPNEDFSLKCSCGLTLKPLDYKITAKLRGELLKNKYVMQNSLDVSTCLFLFSKPELQE
uniref:Cytochrome P450, family 1, subfamily C, polypeptide 1 n=1 Tax=Poecilia latipinna TaxID=48699 RepID=A0A3B3UXG6_9TELE